MIHRPLDAQVHLAVRILGLLLVAAAFATPADAFPLYASREGRNCISCHFDPNGSAMRNEFGFNYGKNRHSMGEEERWANVTVNPQLNDWIRLGMDTRIMYFASHQDGASTSTSTFFPMEGNLRLAITPHDYLTIVGTHGLVVESPGFPDSYVARELYGLFHGFAKDLYIQVGRFRLPFGLRQEDHTSFTRSSPVIPYDSQREDAGIEVGAIGSNWFGEVSFTNGDEPFGQNASTLAAKVGRASRAFQFGLSGYDRSFSSAPDIYRWSLYASTTRGRFTLLGEYVANDFNLDVSRKAAFTEVVYRLSRGLDLRAKLDYYGPPSGAPFQEVWRRYLAEVDINPMPFTDIKVSYRRYNYGDAPDMDEYFAMLFIPF